MAVWEQGLLLMLIPAYFWRFKTGHVKPVLIGTVRMIIQLFLISLFVFCLNGTIRLLIFCGDHHGWGGC